MEDEGWTETRMKSILILIPIDVELATVSPR